MALIWLCDYADLGLQINPLQMYFSCFRSSWINLLFSFQLVSPDAEYIGFAGLELSFYVNGSICLCWCFRRWNCLLRNYWQDSCLQEVSGAEPDSSVWTDWSRHSRMLCCHPRMRCGPVLLCLMRYLPQSQLQFPDRKRLEWKSSTEQSAVCRRK